MKGTIFSSDYCIDESNNLRLLEVNTDTAFITSTFGDEVSVDPLIAMMTGSIDSVYVIYKPPHHQNFVEYLSQSVATATSHSFTAVAEDIDSIYPTVPEDADNKFIIRLAYDESAILDSIYAKGKLNLLKLFNENSADDQIVEFYYSGSDQSGSIDTIDRNNISPDNVIDAVVKTATETHTQLKMYKFGKNTSGSSDRWNEFIAANETTDTMIQQYHYNPSALQDGRVASIRSFHYVWGSDLDAVNLGTYKVKTYFDLPTTLTPTIDNDVINNEIDIKHKYEFATNHITEKWYGVATCESLISSSGDFLPSSTAATGSNVLSFFISGSPQDNENWPDWYHSGNTLPNGSHATGSLILTNEEKSSVNNLVSEIILDGGAVSYTSPNEGYLVYNTPEDRIQWEFAQRLFPTTHSIWVSGSGFTAISASNVGVTDSNITYRVINVEDDDNYQLSGSNMLVHNAPCFVAGTKITVKGAGDPVEKNIEDVVVGDNVLSYNHESDNQEYKEVLEVTVKEDQPVVYIECSPDNRVICTHDHPFYVSGSGYSAYKPNLSALTDRVIEVGDKILHKDGTFHTIIDIEEDLSYGRKVYNLHKIADNNNFFANGLLAHNRWIPCCFAAGTEISLANGDVKSIEDIVVGDEVLGHDGFKMSTGVVTDINHKHRVGNRSLYTINDTGIEFTPEHPFYTKEGWKSLAPDISQEPYLSQQKPKILKEGDFINIYGEWEEIKEIKIVRSEPEEPVYNFTVADMHTYVANGIVVHNK